MFEAILASAERTAAERRVAIDKLREADEVAGALGHLPQDALRDKDGYFDCQPVMALLKGEDFWAEGSTKLGELPTWAAGSWAVLKHRSQVGMYYDLYKDSAIIGSAYDNGDGYNVETTPVKDLKHKVIHDCRHYTIVRMVDCDQPEPLCYACSMADSDPEWDW